MKFSYFSPGYFHAREDLFLCLARNFSFKVVDVCCQPKNGIPSQEYLDEVSDGIWHLKSAKLSRMRWFEPFLLLNKMINYIYKTRPDWIICSTQFPLHSKYAFILRPFFHYKLAYVNEVWCNPINSFLSKLNHKFAGFILRKADAVLSRGTASSSYVCSTFGVEKEKVFLWPLMAQDLNGMPMDSQGIENLLKDDSVSVRFGYIGRFAKDKGLDELLTAFLNLKKKNLKIQLILVGGKGDFEEKLRLLAKQSPDIIILDWVPPQKLRYLYSSIDCFVLPSYYDGFSTVCCEASSCGLPLIVTDQVGGSVDLIKDDVNGTIVQSKSVSSLEHAMEKWGKLSRSECKERGKVSRDLFLKMSSFNNHLNALGHLSNLSGEQK